jgi:MGT family glycosyltransferase
MKEINSSVINISYSKCKFRFAFFGIPSLGHTNPTLYLVQNLTNLGHQVLYFNTLPFKDLIENTGAKFIDYESFSLNNVSIPISFMEPHEVTIELQKVFLKSCNEILAKFLPIFDSMSIDAILYDQMAIWGYIFSEICQLPSFCSNTMFLFTPEEMLEHIPKAESLINDEYKKILSSISKYYDGLKSYKDVIILQSGIKSQRVITYSSFEFQPDNDVYKNSKYMFLGNRYDSQFLPSTGGYLSPTSLIYISLGTVFNEKVEIFKLFIDYLSNTQHQVIISVGRNETLFNQLKQYIANNNIQIYKFVNQLDILSNASLFITHAGFNSIYEGIYFNVLMLMVPQIPEQRFNAEHIQKLNAGHLLKKDELTQEGILEAFSVINKKWNSYKEASNKIRQSFLNSSKNLDIIRQMTDIIINIKNHP